MRSAHSQSPREPCSGSCCVSALPPSHGHCPSPHTADARPSLQTLNDAQDKPKQRDGLADTLSIALPPRPFPSPLQDSGWEPPAHVAPGAPTASPGTVPAGQERAWPADLSLCPHLQLLSGHPGAVPSALRHLPTGSGGKSSPGCAAQLMGGKGSLAASSNPAPREEGHPLISLNDRQKYLKLI